jgi:anti-sigma-K factor RskA
MTGPERSEHPHACGDDVAAYALGALEPAEADAFRHHLESCAVCRDELAAFTQVNDVLPMSVTAHEAPPRLRRSVMRAIADEQHPGGAAAMRPRRRVSGWSWALVRMRPRPMAALGAAVVLAAAVIAGVTLSRSRSPAGTRVIAASVVGRGTAQLRVTDAQAQLVVHHFAAPPAGEIYEVWLVRSGGKPMPTSALFSVTSSGDGDVDVPGNLRGVAKMMVTIEPAGGSSVPTNPPILTANLT